jgi:hypothetical protein
VKPGLPVVEILYLNHDILKKQGSGHAVFTRCIRLQGRVRTSYAELAEYRVTRTTEGFSNQLEFSHGDICTQ